MSASRSHLLAKRGCRGRRAGREEREWSAWLNMRGSIWEETRVSATCKNRNDKAEISSLCSSGPALDGADHCQGCPVFPRLTYQEAAGIAQLPCSAAWLSADCISTGSFLLPKVFPSIWLPSHSTAPCMFALTYFTLVHCSRRHTGLASASALFGAHPSPGSDRVSGHWACSGWREGTRHSLSTRMCCAKTNRLSSKAPRNFNMT